MKRKPKKAVQKGPKSARRKKKSAKGRRARRPAFIRSRGGTEYRPGEDGNYYSPSGILLAAVVLNAILSGESHASYTPCKSDGSTFNSGDETSSSQQHDTSPSSSDDSYSSSDSGSDSSSGDSGGGDSGGGGGGGGD
ncbi:MAG: hypothetical protein G01um101456_81 [Parcubacteria group bacterium Gr01-1014_56]|nr:MAG: hypothetical protein G01um101456_81 [Parcubacteria group bacterium Gr01-1014_56]